MGHNLTIGSNALTWILYQLALSKHVQRKLRLELYTISHAEPSLDVLNALPYLDHVVREGLRIHAPVTSTMRCAALDDVVPLCSAIRDRSGKLVSEIQCVCLIPSSNLGMFPFLIRNLLCLTE